MAADHHRHRFSAWDGTQDRLDTGVDELFDSLSRSVFHGQDTESALRGLLWQGWDDELGRHREGLEQLLSRVRRMRRMQLERFNLDGVFTDIQEKIDTVLRHERRGLNERLASATDDTARRVLERIAGQRRQTLDNLPAEPGGAIRELRKYEFIDRRAERAFDRLLEDITSAVTDQYFKNVARNMRNMGDHEADALRRMVHDLNDLIGSHVAGLPAEDVQARYDRFKSAWGTAFPGAPPAFAEFLELLQRQIAGMDSMMQSLSPETRYQLHDLANTVFSDPALQGELEQLTHTLGLLSPGRARGRQYRFFGEEQLALDEAMTLMGTLQSMEELESALQEISRSGDIDDATGRRVRDLLGGAAGDSIDRLQQAARELTDAGLVERSDTGLRLTARGLRKIGQRALTDLFGKLGRDRFGGHPLPRDGVGGERGDDTTHYEFGDAFDLNVERTVMNAVRRESAAGASRGRGSGCAPRLHADDFAVHRNDATTRSTTVLMLDMSRSMPLRGYFPAAKKVAMALDALIRSRFPHDHLHVIGFSDYAREIAPASLADLAVNEYVYGTNLQHGLMLARRLLARDHGANKQIVIISDGEPTAHMEGPNAVFFYPPLPETFNKTLAEVRRCTRDNIMINTFMLESNRTLAGFVDRMAKLNHGRTFFISPDRLGDHVLVDYARRRGFAS